MLLPTDLLLDVWRQTCRHLDLTDALDRVTATVAAHLPASLVLIRRLDPTRGFLDTVAAVAREPMTPPTRVRSECVGADRTRFLDWCAAGTVCRGPSSAWPEPPTGDALALPLEGDGVLLLHAPDGGRYGSDHEAMAVALGEPLAVALENDRKLRELRTVREAVEADNRSLRLRLGRPDPGEAIVGADSGLRGVMDQVDRVAGAGVPVLILGETGSGKEVVARALHSRSGRSAGPFLRVNCGAIPPELVDSELFGHERGSFTGAVAGRAGWFERADGGTLFLDECGELPLAVQVRLLRILQDGTFQRVGAERVAQVDVRIVAATHRDLRAMVADGRFREDLWYRLAVFPIQLPPLRDRPEDVPDLAAHFATQSARRLGMPVPRLTPADVQLLVAYHWPGNVRELSAVIERATILGDGQRLEVARALGAGSIREPVAAVVRAGEPSEPFPSLDGAMRRHIEAALARTRGRIEGPDGAAALLHINPHTLRARMRKLGVAWQRFRPRPAA